MTEEEKQFAEEAKKNGVELDELNTEGETPEQKAEAEAKAKEEADAKAKEEAEAKAKADAEGDDDGDDEGDKKPESPTEKKRTIYTDYKEKKTELRTEKALREEAEKKLAKAESDLKAILEKSENADTNKEKKEALDKFDEFAKKIDADPVALKEMRDLILEGAKVPESLIKDLEDIKAWKAERAGEDEARKKENAQKQFEDEFTQTLPALKAFFPKANDSEMQAIKKELDKLSHSTGWNDKDLDYIAFKHKDQLSALVSPKKRGMESTEHVDDSVIDADFDPNADLSKMSPTARAAWEVKYNAIMKKPEGLSEGAGGKKIMI